MVVLIYLFFKGNPGHESNLHILVAEPEKVLNFFLFNAGSGVGYSKLGQIVSLAAGLGAVLWFLRLLQLRYYAKNPFLFCTLVLVLLTLALIAFGRVNYYHMGLAQNSRNRIYSLLLFGLIYLSAAEVSPPKFRNMVTAAFLLLGIGTFTLSVKTDWPEAAAFSERQKAAKTQCAADNRNGKRMPDQGAGEAIMVKFIKNGFYTP